MTLIYYKSIRKLSKTIPLWLLTLSVCWIFTRPDLHRHRLSNEASSSSRPIKQINNNCFTLLPVLVLRLCKFDIRVIAPVTENIHTESYLSEKSVRCFFDCVCKCVCKWRHRVKYTEGYLSEKSVRCFCDYCVCKWRVQMECTCVPPCS